MRHATELALFNYKMNRELAEKSGQRGFIPPVSLYLHYHLELSKEMDKGSISIEAIERIAKENSALMEKFRDLNE